MILSSFLIWDCQGSNIRDILLYKAITAKYTYHKSKIIEKNYYKQVVDLYICVE